jgi:uncharacterized delta-60 repeat protein
MAANYDLGRHDAHTRARETLRGRKVMLTNSNSQFASLLAMVILLGAATPAAAQAGHLDPTFGNGGVAVTDFGVQYQQQVAAVGAVAIQTDGKIVVAGGVPAGNRNGFPSFAVARYQTNGSLDTTFGVGGIALVQTLYGNFAAVAIQPDGKIVAGGAAGVVRFNSNGSLDSTFGKGGIVTLFGPFTVSGIALETNGTIAVAASHELFLLSSSGVSENKGTPLPNFASSASVAVSNNKILVGSSFPSFVLRYTSSGSLDTTFAINGQMATPGPANVLALPANGNILVAGSLASTVTTPEPTLGFVVSSYKSAGITDPKFATNGGIVTPLSGLPAITTTGLGIEPTTGYIVVSGTASNLTNGGSEQAFGLARYTAQGQLDASFGTNGTVITSFTNTFATASGLAIQSDGKIVVVGTLLTPENHGGSDTAFVVARYLAQ